MSDARPPLRVELAPVGFYIDRVVEPVIKHDADRVYLTRTNNEGSDLAKPFRDEIVARLRKWKPGIDIRVVRTERWNLPVATETIASVIRKEVLAGNSVWVNLSSGNKLEAVAGAFACMAHGGHPYYVRMSSYERSPPVKPIASGVEAIESVPVYTLGHPTIAQLAVLELLAENSPGLSKKQLLAGLVDAGLVPKLGEGGNALSIQAGYARLQAIIENLASPIGLVRMEGARKAGRVQITPTGSLALRIFSPRPYPDESAPDRLSSRVRNRVTD